jgi:hypothetical protein
VPKHRRAIGIYAEGRRLRFALVHRDGKEFRVESTDTVVLRDPVSDLAATTGRTRDATSADPFGLESFLTAEEAVQVDQSNVETLLDIIEQYSEDVEVYAVSCTPVEANFTAVSDNSRARNKQEWLAWGSRQGLTLESGQIPRLFEGKGKNGWVLFHPASSPLLELFKEASKRLGRYRPQVRLMEDPRISLVEGAALGGYATPDQRVILLHQDMHGGWLIELLGKRIHAVISLSPEEWQGIADAHLSERESSRDISLAVFSGSLEREQVESFAKDKLPGARIEPLVVLPWDDDTSGAPESLAAFAIPVALAAKALAPRDSRFYLAPPITFSRFGRNALLEPSITRIVVFAVALIGIGGFVVQHVQQSGEIKHLRAQAARLEVVTKGQAEAQSLYLSLDRGHSADVRDQWVLDSLLTTTIPLAPVLDILCEQGRHIGDFWLTDFDWSPDETIISGIALRREHVDKIARILSGARLTTVTTRHLDGQTVHLFTVKALRSIAAEDS